MVHLSYLPGEVFTGKAIYIYPALDPQTRTAKVRFEFPNPHGKLKPEMYANVEIKVRLGQKLAVPEGAIIDTGVDASHPFLAGKILAQACFSNPEGTNTSYCPGGATQSTVAGSGLPCPDYTLGCWHGTHIAGIAAGRAGVLSATSGMAPDAGVISIQVFQRTSTGAIVAYDSDILVGDCWIF